MRKWQDDTIKYILNLRASGWSYTKIAKKYGVTGTRIRRIIKDYADRERETSATELGLSARVINCLKRANIPINPYDIYINIAILLNIDGLGDRSLQEIIQFLQSYNIL